ncbi:MAG TPA: Hsp20/alpha crystallin family protein [Verrucomicrobiae bacterium]|nr:Hsp20/alpha crystallin family protein [Verrucomicrobiae bacterium]
MRSFKTMSLTHYDPLAGLRQFEDAFSRFFTEPQTNRPWAPAVDIYETENELVLKADVPDVSLKDIDVRMENQTLTIAGERKFEEKKDSGKGFHRIERSYGSFVRSFAVPSAFDTDKINASYRNGVLTVTLPKKEAAKPRQIKVAVQE